jgi:8-oxo-dGTP pyrophosphatase MutT (NUDIX family)
MKTISVGTIITDNKSILLGHISGTNKFDIPKGEHESCESYFETAVRELKEEFGLEFSEDKFECLGLFSYTKKKDLFLYKIVLNNLYCNINFQKLHCNSVFIKELEEHSKIIKEIDFYKIVPINFIKNHCYSNMTKVLTSILIKKEGG